MAGSIAAEYDFLEGDFRAAFDLNGAHDRFQFVLHNGIIGGEVLAQVSTQGFLGLFDSVMIEDPAR